MQRRRIVRILLAAMVLAAVWSLLQAGAGLAQDKKKAKNPEEGKKGTLVGLLVNKGENFIEVKGDGEEKARKFVPEWKGGAPAQGGGLDKATLKTFRALKVGSRVEVNWLFEERLRALGVKVLKLPDNKGK